MKLPWMLVATLFFGLSSYAAADGPQISKFSAELEMKDCHETVFSSGLVEAGKPITLKFKNDAVVRVTPIAIQDNNVRLKAQILRSEDGSELYNATFITRYNTETDIYEKKPDGDLIYRLKINPQVDEHK
jgi:hypothetical protein